MPNSAPTTVRNIACSALLAAGSAVAMSKIISPGISIASTVVLCSHEAGHVYSAWMRGAKPDAPIILPLGVASIGITPITNYAQLSPRAKRYIIASGPTAGIAATVGLIPFCVISGAIPLSGLLLIGCAEAFSGIFGSDGTKFKTLGRHAREQK